jgi:hypothetical protein
MAESILDRFKQQYEHDKLNENYDLPEDSAQMTASDMDGYKKLLDELRNDENDMEAQFKKYAETYKNVSESELKTEVYNPVVAIKKAYCPKYGKEIICERPVMFNAWTGDKIVRYDCECGATMNLEYAYPRVIYLDENKKEMKVWAE